MLGKTRFWQTTETGNNISQEINEEDKPNANSIVSMCKITVKGRQFKQNKHDSNISVINNRPMRKTIFDFHYTREFQHRPGK